jgi:hypothetical protein
MFIGIQRETWRSAARLFAACTLLACGDSVDDGAAGKGGSDVSPQCDSPDGYVAFDSAHHEAQDKRLAAHLKMLALMDDAVADDGTVDGSKFADALELYTDPVAAADLQTKVQERLDEHLSDQPLVGDRIDATIVAWLEAGQGAETPLQAHLAREWVDKSLQEFFFLSVFHELRLGEREKWDEAYGYYGSGPHNDEDDLAGLALTASELDGTNGTNLGAEVFNALIDGACQLDMALGDDESIDVSTDEGLSDTVAGIDGDLQTLLAYAVGHEAFEMSELIEEGATDTDELFVQSAELQAYFLPLERIMLEAGGDSAMRAAEIRSILDAAPGSDPEAVDVSDTSWIEGFDAARIIELVEAEFDIQVKG